MAEFPALPLWTDAYLADCAHLSDAEHGRYLLILFELWRAPKQRLPNDDDWLARRFRRTPEQVRAELRPLIAEFCKSDGNFITQKRLAREWKYVAERSKAQSERAKRRWKKDKPDAGAHAEPHITGNAPTPTPTPTPTSTPISKNLSERSSTEPAREDFETKPDAGSFEGVPEADDPTARAALPAAVRNPRPNGRTHGPKPIGAILTGATRLKPQDRADEDMRRFLTGNLGRPLAEAVDIVASARDPTREGHAEALRLVTKISAENRLGWFHRERAA